MGNLMLPFHSIPVRLTMDRIRQQMTSGDARTRESSMREQVSPIKRLDSPVYSQSIGGEASGEATLLAVSGTKKFVAGYMGFRTGEDWTL